MTRHYTNPRLPLPVPKGGQIIGNTFRQLGHGCPKESSPELLLGLKEYVVFLCVPIHVNHMPKHFLQRQN